MEPVLRRATPGDTPALVDLHHLALRAVGADAAPGPWDDDLDDVLAHYVGTGGEFLVLDLVGTVVGMGARRRVDATTGEIKRMRVHPSHQGHGRRTQKPVLPEDPERAPSRRLRPDRAALPHPGRGPRPLPGNRCQQAWYT
ncbi:GNAT family N-acetyltransferase [Kineosporia succinea]|uniref:GNAT superfamily N-acetyltransferase n=1 Tax=Kineosporia succinea TaxID=84632 RepID=A0ABT9PBY2_9ACTN|nr:GNAT family N-acetyltransferase [Kineosporia succinea]MDP9830011.1 GNAT superfamily N-acetyltransferase [Kineosporia succinea]